MGFFHSENHRGGNKRRNTKDASKKETMNSTIYVYYTVIIIDFLIKIVIASNTVMLMRFTPSDLN